MSYKVNIVFKDGKSVDFNGLKYGFYLTNEKFDNPNYDYIGFEGADNGIRFDKNSVLYMTWEEAEDDDDSSDD